MICGVHIGEETHILQWGVGGLPAHYNIHDHIYFSVDTLNRHRDIDSAVTLCTLKLDGGWFLQ